MNETREASGDWQTFRFARAHASGFGGYINSPIFALGAQSAEESAGNQTTRFVIFKNLYAFAF